MRTVVHLRSRAAALAVVGMLMTVLAVVSVAPGVAAATPVSGDCPSGLSGLGTAASPCQIGTAAQLYTAMTGINADTNKNGASTDDYELTANINATSYSSGTAGATTSYGATEDWGGINWFSGTFFGNGYAISNLTYTTDSYTATLPGPSAAAGSNLGFFRVLNDATIENLTLQNVDTSSSATNDGYGGIAVWAFSSTVTGVAVIDSTVLDAGGGGNDYGGGLVALSYANSYSNYTSSTSDGGATTFTNDEVSGGTIANYNRQGGILGAATGTTTISDNYVNVALSNPDHPPYSSTNGTGVCYYSIGGLLGQTGTGQVGSAQPVAMSNNVIQGSISYLTSGAQSSGTQNYTGPTVGCAQPPTTGGWTSVNNLVSSAFSYTHVTGSPIASAAGTSLSPATLQTESTYSGTATGLTDPSTGATYNDLAWNFVSGNGGSAWGWNGTATNGTPYLVVAPTITLGNSTISFIEGAAQSDSNVLTDANASTNFGTLSVNTSSVNWSTPGTYAATVTATNDGITTNATLTIVIVGETVPLAQTTGGIAESNTAPGTATVLAALGATLPAGDGGTLSVTYPNGEPTNWNTSGSYSVEVIDNGGVDDLQPATATLLVVEQPTVTVANSTVAFNLGTSVTVQGVVNAVDPTATYQAGDSGTVSANISTVGSTTGFYTATITATDQYGVTSAPVTVTVAITNGTILLGDSTPIFQATTSEPTAQTILNAFGAVLPAGSTGTATVSGYTASDFQTPGEYTVTISDSNAADSVPSVTATLEIVAVSVVTVTNPTVYFNTSNPPTTSNILSASGAEVTNGGGLPVPGSSLSVNLPTGCGTTAGSCTATITGTDAYGFTTAPVNVTVDVSAATVSVSNDTVTYHDTGSVPSQAALVSALGATVTGSTAGGQIVVNTSSVDWSVPGTYGVIVSDSNSNDETDYVTATIQIVPTPIVTLPATTVYLPVNANDPLPASTLLANSGATLTDGEGNAVAGNLSADTSAVNGTVAGTYSATITGTDHYGYQSAPVTVTVVMYLTAQQAGTVSITGTALVGGTLTANLSGWAGLAAPEYQWMLNGLPIPGATSVSYAVTSADLLGAMSVEATEAPQYYELASATSAAVTIAVGTGASGGSGYSGSPGSSTTQTTDASASASPDIAGAFATYTIDFTASSQGALVSGADSIYVSLPGAVLNGCYAVEVTDLTTGDSGLSAYCVLGDGITAPINIGAGDQVQVLIYGLTTPSVPGSQSFSVSTSQDGAAVGDYSLVPQLAVSAVSATVIGGVAEKTNSTYLVSFEASAQGALAAGADQITVDLPGSSGCSGSATIWDRTTGAMGEVTCQSALPDWTFFTPIQINGGDTVSIEIQGVTTPSSAGSQSVTVSTSSDSADTTGYTLLAPGSTPAPVCAVTGIERAGQNGFAGAYDEEQVTIDAPAGLASVNHINHVNGSYQYPVVLAGTTAPFVITAIKAVEGQMTVWSFDVNDQGGQTTYCH
jgi:hypothetical protein